MNTDDLHLPLSSIAITDNNVADSIDLCSNTISSSPSTIALTSSIVASAYSNNNNNNNSCIHNVSGHNRTKVEKPLNTGSSALISAQIQLKDGIGTSAAIVGDAVNVPTNINTKNIDDDVGDCNRTRNEETQSPTPKIGSNISSRRNSNKTRHCTSLPIFFHNAENTELCEISSRPGMDCMPLRAPPGQYHHYHHVSDQTKSLQELQNEVGALLEFRDLVIETFPDLKHKMASMSATNTLTGMASSSSLASRREWEPGIRVKRKITPKENSTDIVVSSSLIRSRSNSHSGKKEPKSGEGNGSVVQDSGFSTETSSSKEAHSASSTTGAMQGTVASNRLSAEADDELLNLLDVIHRKSNRLRDEVEYLQNLEKDKFRKIQNNNSNNNNSSDSNINTATTNSSFMHNHHHHHHHHNYKTFQDHVDKLNREDLQILRKERDRLLDKLAEMEAETLSGRIKATKMQDQFEELCSVKKQLEEQLKLALSQKLELNSRLNELQRQFSNSSKSSSSQSESTATNSSQHRNSSTTILSGPITVVTTTIGSGTQILGNSLTTTATGTTINRGFSGATTFTPVIVESSNSVDDNNAKKLLKPFHNINYSDSHEILKNLGRLDGLISSPNRGLTKVRVTDSRKIAAILLETNVIELQRHLLTLTVQNQVLTQRLEQATKSKILLFKKLDRSKEEIDNVRFQLEEKDIELEGTKAQLRVLEAKTPLKLDFNSGITNLNIPIGMNEQTNRSSSSTMILSPRDIDSPTTPTSGGIVVGTQISTPSMKAMIPLQMDDMQQQHHSSSTESAQDQTERDLRLNYSTGSVGGIVGMSGSGSSSGGGGGGSGCPETPKRRPSKIPLPGTKGYLAPKPPTGRCSTILSTSTTAHQQQQKISPSSGTVSNKSLSRSTGNLYGKSGPSSVKRIDFQGNTSSTIISGGGGGGVTMISSSLNRPESAQSNTTAKDNSLGLNSSRSSSSSIPISSSTKLTPSPHKLICNSPLPKPKRDSLTSRVRHLDSLSRVYNMNNGNNTSATAATTSSSTPSSPSSPPTNSNLNNSSNNNFSSNNNYNNSTSNLIRFTTNSSSSTYSKKDLLSSSFTQQQQHQGQLRPNSDRGSNNAKNNLLSSSSSSTGAAAAAITTTTTQHSVNSRRISASYGRGSNSDLNQQQHNNNNQQNESESGKVRNLRSTLLGWLKI